MTSQLIRWEDTNLEIPVVVGLDFSFIRVYLGPRFIIPMGDDLESSINNAGNYSFSIADDNMPYQVGVGLDFFRRLTLDVTYNGYFTDFNDVWKQISGDAYSTEHPDCHYKVSLGFYFGGKKKK